MKRCQGHLSLLLLVILVVSGQAYRFQLFSKPGRPGKSLINVDLNPFNDDDEDETIAAKVLPGTSALLTLLYGSILVVYPFDCRGQVYFLTMMRSTGYNKIEEGIKACRQNMRQAFQSAIWHAPSFLMAARSITQMRNRVEQERLVLAATKKAKEDGIITEREARRIKRMRKNQIRTLQRDMKRLIKAGGSLKTVLKVLDVGEVLDIIKSFLFQLTTVLATGNGKTALGIFIARWCMFLNLGSLFLDLDHKLGFPLTTIIVRGRKETGEINEKKVKLVRNTGKFLVYSTSGYISFFQPVIARHLNSAMLGAAVIFRGLKALNNVLWDKKDGQDSMARNVGTLIDGPLGGVIMLTVASYGVFFGYLNRKGKTAPPSWLQPPIDLIEGAIGKLTDVLRKEE